MDLNQKKVSSLEGSSHFKDLIKIFREKEK